MGGRRGRAAAVAMLLVPVLAGCASTPQPIIPSPTGVPSADSVPSTATPPTPASPSAPSSVTSAPSDAGSVAPLVDDGWTYTMVRDACIAWINSQPIVEPPVRYDFDTELPAERYADAWNLGFPAVRTDPMTDVETAAVSTCTVSGTPDAYGVDESEFVGDTTAAEGELLP